MTIKLISLPTSCKSTMGEYLPLFTELLSIAKTELDRDSDKLNVFVPCSIDSDEDRSTTFARLELIHEFFQHWLFRYFLKNKAVVKNVERPEHFSDYGEFTLRIFGVNHVLLAIPESAPTLYYRSSVYSSNPLDTWSTRATETDGKKLFMRLSFWIKFQENVGTDD